MPVAETDDMTRGATASAVVAASMGRIPLNPSKINGGAISCFTFIWLSSTTSKAYHVGFAFSVYMNADLCRETARWKVAGVADAFSQKRSER